jgi:type VI secretion system secreted protein VgrG
MSCDKISQLSLTGPAGTTLVPIRVVAHEAISELFRYEIEAVAARSIDAVSVLNKPACLAVNHGEASTRYFHGIVGEFGPIARSGAVDTLYRMVLVPQLAEAELQIDCRLFFNKTAQDILKTILTDAGVTNVIFRLYS